MKQYCYLVNLNVRFIIFSYHSTAVSTVGFSKYRNLKWSITMQTVKTSNGVMSMYSQKYSEL